MEGAVEVRRVVVVAFLLALLPHPPPDPAHGPGGLESESADEVERGREEVYQAEVCEEVREGYEAAWASGGEEVGVGGAVGGFGSGGEGVEDVGVLDGVGCD